MGSFIWHQLLKDVLQKMSTDPISERKEMIDICYKYYRNNKKELQNIQRFEKIYKPDDAIQWYTKDCFIYRLINKALRTENIEVLHTFRYFINGLSTCLMNNYELIKDSQADIWQVYRGIKQTSDEIQLLKRSIGNLISTNGFFSTTRHRPVAEIYAGIGSNIDKFESLLFEININIQTHKNCIFADISCYSQFGDEEEVLFDLGTVFEILSVDYNPIDKYWLCKMASTDRGLQIADEYLTLRRGEMANEKIDLVILFGELLYDMVEYKKSQKYFENLLSSRNTDPNVYMGIAHAQYIQGQNEEAIINYKHALTKCDPSEFLLTAKILRYLALLYKFSGQNEMSLNYVTDVLKLLESNELSNESNRIRADVATLLPQIYNFLGNGTKALEYADTALNIIKTLVPCPHLDLVEALTSSALAYRKAGDYNASLDRQTKALEIIKQVLPDNHQYLGVALNNIGKAYYKKCDYDNAIHYLAQSLEVYANVWPGYHQRRAIPLNHLGKCYYRLNDYNQALDYYLQAMEMLEKTVSSNHTDRAYTVKNIGEVYLDLLDFDKALTYFRHAMNIYKENTRDNSTQPDVAKCYYLIGRVYLKQNDSEHALELFLLTWNMWQSALIHNHPDLALCAESCGHAYLGRLDYGKALEYFSKALDIYEKGFTLNEAKITVIKNLIDDTKQKIHENNLNSL
ncbi:unnamed protein product [Adineta steineri]|uniref:NAD(P)(+)--arginine ADP-ribosyltransferase n=1 Tax=Adineta steineri TaxID=433720 RepID=A0A813SR59_9BILA|nr:unnamed protein product [Adineta steineri]CAF1187712.1 unnamed protein product [Adineta steineri]